MDRNSKWSNERKSSVQVIICCLVLVIVIGICSAIALGVMFCTGRGDNEVCVTPGCIHTASKVLRMMDPTTDPCEDFYQFACGNYIRETNIPDEEAVVSTANEITDLVEEKMRTIIEEPIQTSESKPVILIKKFYKACMNKTIIEEIGLKHVKALIQEFGGWPVVDGGNWNKNSFDWKKLMYKIKKNGFEDDSLITLFIDIDQKNSSKYIPNIDQPFLMLPRETLLEGVKNELVKAYFDYMVDISIIFGAIRMNAVKELSEVLHFETLLANISDPNEIRRDPTTMYNPMTIKQLQETYTSIPWLEYIGNLFAPHQKITEDDVVVVNSLNFFTKFEELMNKTSPRVLGNYLMWRAVSTTISYLPDDIRKRQLEYSKIHSGNTAMTPRWKECIDNCLRLDIASSALYVRKYFKKDARKNVNKIAENILYEMKESLKKIDWMDEKTRNHALEKANTIVKYIGYPIELLDDEKLEDFYKELEIDEKDYMRSSLNIHRFNIDSVFKKLREPVNKTDWITHSSSTAVNAFYSPNENSIQFPAGILQGSYFHKHRPHYMNYGGIGFIIGHEITHGFDDEGRQYDKDGNVKEWWVNETKEAFNQKAQCVIYHYGNYTVPEIEQNLNGFYTQGENIADIGGLKQAYLAYDRWVKSNGEEPHLPGLNYTGRQLFWISAANIWCSKTRPEILKQRVISDTHSPDKYRVWGTVSNLREFAKDFKCKEGTKMNPIDKCELW